MNSSLVTVVIPLYNSEKLIERCLNSIVRQDYKNLEVIVVNDGSTDNSEVILTSYLNKDPRITLINQENSGVSKARNNGIKLANGKYIAFVDSDDEVKYNYISKMVSVMESKNVDLVICNYEIMNNNRIDVNTIAKSFVLTPKQIFENYWEYYHKGYINAPWNKLYKLENLRKNMITFPENISMGEDGYFNINYFLKCDSIYVLGDYLYKFHIHEDQTTKKLFKNHFYMLKKVFDNIENAFKMFSLIDNESYMNMHYMEYFNELKLSIKYIVNDGNLKIKEKRMALKTVASDTRTKEMLNRIKNESLYIKDRVLFFFLKHKFFS